jgi:CubicO group peptidase (beta-lactamase class C family)
MSYGHLLGELVLRVTGMSLGAFFRTNLAEVCHADFHIGVGDGVDHRIAELVPPSKPPRDFSKLDPNEIAMRSFSGPKVRADTAMTDRWRRAEVGAANGHGNARSVARLQSVVSHNGDAGWGRLLRTRTLDAIFETQSVGRDLVLGVDLEFGNGYALGLPPGAADPGSGRRCYWIGFGGSVVVNDLDNSATFAYVMNRMGSGLVGSTRTLRLIDAFYRGIKRY